MLRVDSASVAEIVSGSATGVALLEEPLMLRDSKGTWRKGEDAVPNSGIVCQLQGPGILTVET